MHSDEKLHKCCEEVDAQINASPWRILKSDASTQFKLGMPNVRKHATAIISNSEQLQIPLKKYISYAIIISVAQSRQRLQIHALASVKMRKAIEVGEHIKLQNKFRAQKEKEEVEPDIPTLTYYGSFTPVMDTIREIKRAVARYTAHGDVIGWLVGSRNVLDPCVLYMVPTIRRECDERRLIFEDMTPAELRKGVTRMKNNPEICSTDEWKWWSKICRTV